MARRSVALAVMLVPLAAAAQAPELTLPRVVYGETLPNVVYGPASEAPVMARILPPQTAPTIAPQGTSVTRGWVPVGPPVWVDPGRPGWLPPRPFLPRPTPGADRVMPQGMPTGQGPASFGNPPARDWRPVLPQRAGNPAPPRRSLTGPADLSRP